jgi:flagellar biosynthesis/type III secretory pathway protein FliH
VHPFSFDRVFPEDGLAASANADRETKALDEARRQGERLGFEQGMERAEAVRQRLEQLLAAMGQQRSELYNRIEEEILRIIFRIAEKVIRREIRADPYLQKAIIAEGLKLLREDEDVVIRVSPAYFEALQASLPALCGPQGVRGRVTLREDPTVTEGGCILETDQCELDARIESSLKRIEEALRQA